jgi:hypothetical protein
MNTTTKRVFTTLIVMIAITIGTALAVLGGDAALAGYKTGKTPTQLAEQSFQLTQQNKRLEDVNTLLARSNELLSDSTRLYKSANDRLVQANAELLNANYKLVGANTRAVVALEAEAAKGPIDKIMENHQLKERAEKLSVEAKHASDVAVAKAKVLAGNIESATVPKVEAAVEATKGWFAAAKDRIANAL